MSQGHEHIMKTVDSGSDERLCACGYREGAAQGWKPEPSMTPIPPIPEDLKQMYFYASLPEPKNDWAETCVTLIERIAKLTAERDEFERKGKELCSAYGNALITIHDLKAPVSDEECLAFENSYGEKLMLNYVDFGLTEFLASRATRTPPQEGQ